MADIEQLYQALDRADQAGDKAGAADLAAMIKEQQLKSAKPPAEEPGLQGAQTFAVGLPQDSPAPPEGAWAKAKEVLTKPFTRTEGGPVDSREAAGKVLGAGLGGAAANVALPGMLQLGGRALQKAPGPVFKGLGVAAEKLGDVLKKLPAGERAVRGLGGGTAAGIADVAGEALGMSPAETFVASTVLGGVGEATSSLLFKETGKIGTAMVQAAGGDANAAINTIKGVVKPYKELNEASARKLQKQFFGDPLPGYQDKLISSDARSALQEQLRQEDPWLESAFTGQSVMGKAKPVPGTGGPVSASRELFVPGKEVALVAFGKPGAPPLGKTAATQDMAGKMQARGQAQIAANLAGPKNASELYRNRMFEGVTDAINNGKRFSDTPGAQQFFGKLRTLVATGELGQTEARDLIKKLSTDRSPDAAVRSRFAKNLDNEIRDFGKPLEKAAPTGAKAIPADLAMEVRKDLQAAHNQYLESLGMGKLEQRYRETATREYTAAAQDHLQHFLSGKGTPTEFRASARDMMKDPQNAKFLQKGLTSHLAQVDPTTISKEFLRVRDSLVDAKLMTYEEAAKFRQMAEDVQRVADKGVQMGAQKRLQMMLVNGLTRKALGEAGGAVGKWTAPKED